MGNNFVPAFWSKDIEKVFVGFDEQWARLQKLHSDVTKNVPTYPPYNIIKLNDNSYMIEIAVAGFDQHNIDIEITDGKLLIRGELKDTDENNFLFRGIANRAFTRAFVLNDEVEVKDAEMHNGMLKITIERLLPEEKKAKKITIRTKSEKQFLKENK